MKGVGTTHVSRGGISAGELVQPSEQRTCIAHVPTNCAIGPLARAIPVEAKMEFDQGRDIINHVVRETHFLHSLLRHAPTHYLVMVERDTTIAFELPRARLADVM